jgi:glutamate dehydrogenase (NAD(P)+)
VIPDVLLNAGGVVVSYFEWIKNLSHIRFGRMGRRLEQQNHTRLLRAMGGDHAGLSEDAIREITSGGDEVTLVYSGLEDTMILAYNEVRDMQRSNTGSSFRTAAYLSALHKIRRSYDELGIFP